MPVRFDDFSRDRESRLLTRGGDLRTATGDDARAPRYIRTIHGFGYAFAAEASEEAGAPLPTPASRHDRGPAA
jgi:DNA-binding winged helix-turn-helix (wHTH) protein